MVPHGPGQLLVVHLDPTIGLHEPPRAGKVVGVVDPEDSVSVVDPADNAWVVVAIVKQVANENVDRWQRNLRSMLSWSTTLSVSARISQ